MTKVPWNSHAIETGESRPASNLYILNATSKKYILHYSKLLWHRSHIENMVISIELPLLSINLRLILKG